MPCLGRIPWSLDFVDGDTAPLPVLPSGTTGAILDLGEYSSIALLGDPGGNTDTNSSAEGICSHSLAPIEGVGSHAGDFYPV